MEPLYQKIYNDLYFLIKNGRLRTGDLLPTELELSEKYKVSRITASHALNELKIKGFITRTKRKGSVVLPLKESINFTQQIDFFVPLIFPQFDNYDLKILNGMKNYAVSKKCFISFFNSDHSEQQEREILVSLLKEKISGLIILPVSNFSNLDILSEFLINNIPLVFIDFPVEGLKAPCVCSDNYSGIYDITKYLISNGHTKIGFYQLHNSMISTEIQRFNGYCNALIKNHIPVNKDFIFKQIMMMSKDSYKNTEELLKLSIENARLAIKNFMSLKNKPTAIVCVNDLSAYHLLIAAQEIGIKVPEELSITGFDNTDLSKNNNLTTTAQNFSEIGKAALESLFLQIKGIKTEENIMIKTIFIERSSVYDINNNNI